MQGLVIFDVDGTLAQTSQVDDECWSQAALDVLGLSEIDTDWGAYDHSTDEAIAAQLIRERTDLPNDPATIRKVRDRHGALMHAAAKSDPTLFHATGGAVRVFDVLAEHGWASAIATGGWRGTATLKLERAGIDVSDIPAAFAEDAHPREELINIAHARAADGLAQQFNRLVYVGDGPWDVRAAASLGIGFVGVATGARKRELEDAGARVVLPDFEDEAAFLSAIANP
ncbi:MAG: haloacid dehalogenase-like hydrolase [Phycisphaerales bacterium]|nr:haloacid dehalogenase-like hydrolase [Phycisphaerales bacterium]